MKIKLPNMNNPSNPNPQSWERSVLEKVLLQAYQEQRRARIWKLVWRLLWLVLVLSFVFAMVAGKNKGLAAAGKEHTAVISLSGVINSDNNQAAVLRRGLEAAYKNGKVKGIIIRANSPGGSPVVSNIAFEEVRRLKAQHPKIPLYVVTEDVCASGCYYIASAADKIYADPSSIVGSIGVIGGGFDLTEMMDKIGVKRRLKIAGDNKGMGDPFTPETPEQAAIWQQMLDQIHAEFIKAVKLGRGDRLKEAANPDLFSGRIYTGIEGKNVGLVDEMGNIYSVARDVIKAPDLVDYTPNEDFSRVFGRRVGSGIQQGLQGLTDGWW
ncbi:protease-4 [Neisseria sp. HSC-16F19]|nr:S49 family peptidase [Neisseria sp. HSC-16F19]MCP2040958.1 protease-4 [Neisseria sp. HSC-16F19]